jgi:hypothetical protein
MDSVMDRSSRKEMQREKERKNLSKKMYQSLYYT